MSEGHRQPYTDSNLPEVCDYIVSRTKGAMPSTRVNDILANVIAGPSRVYDWHTAKGRALVAVLIDTCASEANAAELSLFFDPQGEPVIPVVVDWALELLKSSGKTFLELPEWKGCRFSESGLQELGFSTAYQMFDMETQMRDFMTYQKDSRIDSPWRWSVYTDENAPEVHGTLGLAFKKVPGAFVPPLEVFRKRWKECNPPAELLWNGGRLAGFVRIEQKSENVGDLAILGRHPNYRGMSLGEKLVARGLELLAQKKVTRTTLEVAAANENALALYRRFGFEIVSQMTVYRRKL